MSDNKTTAKQIVKLYKRKTNALKKRQVRLTDMLINLRTYGMQLKRSDVKLLISNSLEWEYGKKAEILDTYGKYCLSPSPISIWRYCRGNRTYFIDGKFYSKEPILAYEDTPF